MFFDRLRRLRDGRDHSRLHSSLPLVVRLCLALIIRALRLRLTDRPADPWKGRTYQARREYHPE